MTNKIGAVLVCFPFFPTCLFLFTRRESKPRLLLSAISEWHLGCHIPRTHTENEVAKKSFLCHDPCGQTHNPRQSRGTQQEQLSTASLFLSVLVVPCLRLVSLGASIQQRQLVSLSVFALVTCQHTHSHSGKQLCSLVCILESHKDLEVFALSISRHDTWFLVDPLFFPTWLLPARLCYSLWFHRGKRHSVTCKGSLQRDALLGGSFGVTAELKWGNTQQFGPRWQFGKCVDCLVW